jgi:hypothetical protein
VTNPVAGETAKQSSLVEVLSPSSLPDAHDPIEQLRDVPELPVFEQFTSIINPSDGLDLVSPIESSFQTPQLPTSNALCLQQPSPSYERASDCDTQSQGSGRVALWLDTILNDPEDESRALQYQSSRVAGQLQRSAAEPQPIPQILQDYSSVLVEYYFKEVCGMMSCYDGQKNPYRTTISSSWTNSPALYLIIQSMAGACLAEVSPGLGSVGIRLRDQAAALLSKDLNSDSQVQTSSLIALVMLGFSMSWHEPKSLGQHQFVQLSKALRQIESQTESTTLSDKQKKLFFYNSLVYSRMLLSFVCDDEPSMPLSRTSQPQPAQLLHRSHVPPHPQTGIGVQVQEVVAQVGSLVRKERKRIRSRQCTSRTDIEEAEDAIRQAERLHMELCSIEVPTEESILDPGDELTPTSHLIKVAEAYRITGLLQLYRNFPDLLLSNRVPYGSLQEHHTISLQTFSDFEFTQSNTDSRLVLKSWLTALAMHVIDLIDDIPITSRSRSIQPLLTVSICSELSLNRTYVSVSHLQHGPVASISASPRFATTPSAVDILGARRSLLSRLSSFETVLAAKPIRQMMVLVKDTWLAMDKHQQEVYWMDVMLEKGYETLMG